MMREIYMEKKMTYKEAMDFSERLTKRAKRNSGESTLGRDFLKKTLKRSYSQVLLDRERLAALAETDDKEHWFNVRLINTMCDGPEAAMEYLVDNGWARA